MPSKNAAAESLIGATGSPEATPYESIVDALRSALPLVASLKASIWLACIAELLPEMRTRRASLPEVPRIDAESERIRLFESLFRCLSALAQTAPAPARARRHALGAIRLDCVAALSVAPNFRRAGHDRRDVSRRRNAEAASASSAQKRGTRGCLRAKLVVANAIARRRARTDRSGARRPRSRGRHAATVSDGNPLFLTQFIDDIRKGERAAPSASLQTLVASRIGQLSDEARTAAEIAACIGVRFSHDALREVSGWDEASLGNALDELFDRRIVREASGRGLFEYAFSHNVVHEAIVQAVPPERARRAPSPGGARARRTLCGSGIGTFGHDRPALRACGGRTQRRALLPRGSTAIDRARRVGRGARAGRPRARADGRRARYAPTFFSNTKRSNAGEETAPLKKAALVGLGTTRRRPRRSGVTLPHPLAPDRVGVERQRLRQHSKRQSANSGRTRRTAILSGDCTSPKRNSRFRWAGSPNRSRRPRRRSPAAEQSGNDAMESRRRCAVWQTWRRTAEICPKPKSLFDEAGRAAASATDPVLEDSSLSSAFSLAYHRRDIERCLNLGQRRLDRAVALGDGFAEARARGHLAVALCAAGTRYAQARAHFAHAVSFLTEAGDLNGTAGELLNEAVLETRLGSFHKAVARPRKRSRFSKPRKTTAAA